MCKHRLKFLRQSKVFLRSKLVTIDVYQCLDCEKYCIIDTKTDAKISLDGKIGEEI